MKGVQKLPLSASLPKVLQMAETAGDNELARWTRLEALGYTSSNPAMGEDIIVPDYRTVGGQWFDAYDRLFLISDPKLTFINDTRLRAGVAELEDIASRKGLVAIQLSEFAEIIREQLGVEVTTFRFSTEAIPQVLANIKAQLLDRLASTQSNLEKAPTVVPTQINETEILELRPNFHGIGINLKALWRTLRSKSGRK